MKTKQLPVWIAGLFALVIATTSAAQQPQSAPADGTAPSTEAATDASAAAEGSDANSIDITVYKSATCGCCSKWVEHLRESGLRVRAHDVGNLKEIKQLYGVTPPLSACHTALAGPYVIEGHVPAADIRRLLKENPPILGISVPGMPVGSPGMEADRVDRYDVIAFDDVGNTTVFARH